MAKSYKTNNPFNSYVETLAKRFYVDFCLVPEKHTTIVDFLRVCEPLAKNYDVVVAHVGIVDFSPRPKPSLISDLYLKKQSGYDALFGRDCMARHLESDLGSLYEGEQTLNAFSLEMARQSLVPALQAIPNLVYIGCNPLLPHWRGTYWKDRPENINIVVDYAKLLCDSLDCSIAIDDWDEATIRERTVDNIHLSESGNRWMARQIEGIIETS